MKCGLLVLSLCLSCLGTSALAQSPPRLGCAINNIAPALGSYGDVDANGTNDGYGGQLVHWGNDSWVIIEGDPIVIGVGSTGGVGMWACQPAASAQGLAAGIYPQYYADAAWGTNLFANGSRVGASSYHGGGFVAVSQTIASTTPPVDVNIEGNIARVVRLAAGETVSVETVLGTTAGVALKRIITYTKGDYAYRLRFEVSSSAAATDLRVIHGGDTYFGNDDSARSWWNADQNMVYVNNSSFLTSGIMGFAGSPATPADRYFSGQYSTGNGEAQAGQLSNTSDSTYRDAGYQLQWNRANLAAGATWVIEAIETWTDPSAVQVIAPPQQLSPPGTRATLPFIVHNLTTEAITLDLAASTNVGWAASLLGSNQITLAGLTQGAVEVAVDVPAGATVDSVGNITLQATNQAQAAFGSAFGSIKVFQPNWSVSPTSIDFGRIAPGDSQTATVTLTNNGSAVVVGTVGNPNPLAAPFSITANTCSGATVNAGGSCTLTLRFNGSTDGLFSDSFNIPLSAPTVTSVNVSVVGEINGAFGIDNAAGAATYDQTRDPVVVDPHVTVTGFSNLDGAKVTITDGFHAAEDELTCTPMHGITCSYNPATGVLTLLGIATPEQYQEILRTVTYENNAPTSPTAGAKTVQFSLGAAGLYFEPNGHFYEFVTANAITWTAARDAAAARRYFGLQGYLATVTNAQENAFIAAKLAGQGWMGSSDAASEGAWRWVTGPEGLEESGAGRRFWQGNGSGSVIGGFYNNWATGEPNNCCSGENYGHFLANGTWNDYAHNNNSIQGYVVEYGGLAGDPVIEVVDSRQLVVVTCTDGEKNGNETDYDCGGPSCSICGSGSTCVVGSDCSSSVCTGGICQDPTCTDSVKNGDETGTDCGGPMCNGCADGGTCSVGSDCASLVCSGGVCLAATCNDGVKNGAETGTDCGGPTCGPCGTGGGCMGHGDCASLVCADGVCLAATCSDNVRNGDETGIDCGGPSCGPCGTGGGCAGPGDCTSQVCSSNVCQAPACNDGVKNGTETGTDCGGPSCGACGTGGGCTSESDCVSLVCEGGACQAPTCFDSVKNGDETGTDCGGPTCGPCNAGGGCAGAGDCVSQVCDGGICQAPTCFDNVENGDETDTDCGGTTCGPCVDGSTCAGAGDCTSGVCTSGVCQVPTCTDNVKNGDETDRDCGGSCNDCGPGNTCLVGGDCTTGVCSGGTCQVASCNDGVKNGSETDRDCGGPDCGPCDTGRVCGEAAHCFSGVCTNGICQSPTCTDGVKNGTETGTDCGGGACGDCDTGGGCLIAGDCLSNVCTGGFCAAPTCDDGVKNGSETSTDCGGGTCADCAPGASCLVGSDCTSDVCTGGICRAPTCTDGVKNGDETDRDCGGSCGPCNDGGTCAVAGDCTSWVCTGGVCQVPTCGDGVKNGTETDTDCGGTCSSTGGSCDDGGTCAVAGDCTSLVCTNGECQVPTCGDGVKNSTETDTDCGGPCDPCDDGGTCVVAGDCTSLVCNDGECQVPTCGDGVKNSTETDIDCGGPCGPCGDGGACAVAGDCTSQVCTNGVCLIPACGDGVKNGDETDIDCGGSCGPCDDGGTCAVAGDCTSLVCNDGVCQVPTCNDGVKNGDETDTDCGGTCSSDGGACDDGGACVVAGDCNSLVCNDGECQVPTCNDGVKNGDETDTDCGGACSSTGGACGDGGACVVAGDCTSLVCTEGVCQAATCGDGVKNGDETDIDCGGACSSTGGACNNGGTCAVAGDCSSLVCNDGVCQVPTCGDGVKNGNETDIDCGGACGPCTDGGICAVAGDCSSGVCSAGGVCLPATCGDGVENGNETDTDCGGSCGPCNDGGTCSVAGDCSSGVCTGGTCQAATCGDGVKNGTETGTDCGGECGLCGDGEGCATAGDCSSGVCSMGGVCLAETCDDGVKNGTETDIDCGSECEPCATGGVCEDASDCESGICAEGKCVEFALLSPATGDLTRDQRFEVRGTATPGTVVTIEVDGQTYEVTADESGNWVFAPTSDWPEGSVTITVKVGSYEESVTVRVDVTAPTLSISRIDDDGVVYGTGEPGTVIEVRVNGELIGTVTVGDDGTFSIDVSAARIEGENTVEVSAKDEAGNEARATQTFVWNDFVVSITGGGGCAGGGLGFGWLFALGAVVVGMRRRR